MRVVTCNVNGLRAAARKGFFPWARRQRADLVCLQEIRIREEEIPPTWRRIGRLQGHFHCAERKGYSGVAIYAAHPPLGVETGLGWPEADAEGRLLTLHFAELAVTSLYLPSGSSREERQAFKYRYMERLLPWLAARRRGRHLVCGDVNIAHREEDLENWRGNQGNSGFLPEERAWMDRALDGTGWVDVFRRLAPEARGEGYTWWSNRGRAWEKNVGWRIDYHLATPPLAARARRWRIYKARRFSDHAPLVVDYELDLARGPETAGEPST